jgi:hypothetical protein
MFAICIAGLIFCIVMMIKNEFAHKNRIKILIAIRDYKMHCATYYEPEEVDWADMEHYDKTLYRLWDWGCTRILPKEKYEIIEPFIEK